ncbi:MAG: hypothetical protein N3G80_00575 [Candidatus Micrarchaeota archaeon]|nr:hypothetical protein [Candidatus Micrarchaeota archaeon]
MGVLDSFGLQIALDDYDAEVCFVSHAHTDHTKAFSKNRKIIASDETFLLLGKSPSCHPLPQGTSLHQAGHMLGAVQLRAELDGQVFVYTGDFSLHQGYTTLPAKILECDTLMIDSTYALPHLRLPSRADTIRKIAKFVRQNENKIVLLGAYLRGKTQELIRLLNEECGIAPIVSSKADYFCKVYRQSGIKLDWIAAGTPEAQEAMKSAFVAIVPLSQANFSFGAKLSEAFGLEVKTAVVTGWAAFHRFPADEGFPLSDHADFRDTMRYIHESNAKKVICANASDREAAAHLRRIGIDAVAKSSLSGSHQCSLLECMHNK